MHGTTGTCSFFMFTLRVAGVFFKGMVFLDTRADGLQVVLALKVDLVTLVVDRATLALFLELGLFSSFPAPSSFAGALDFLFVAVLRWVSRRGFLGDFTLAFFFTVLVDLAVVPVTFVNLIADFVADFEALAIVFLVLLTTAVVEMVFFTLAIFDFLLFEVEAVPLAFFLMVVFGFATFTATVFFSATFLVFAGFAFGDGCGL